MQSNGNKSMLKKPTEVRKEVIENPPQAIKAPVRRKKLMASKVKPVEEHVAKKQSQVKQEKVEVEVRQAIPITVTKAEETGGDDIAAGVLDSLLKESDQQLQDLRADLLGCHRDRQNSIGSGRRSPWRGFVRSMKFRDHDQSHSDSEVKEKGI